MWTEEDPEKSCRPSPGPMSFAKEGISVWAEQGGWCAVAVCGASDMSAIASKAAACGPELLLDVIVGSARERKVETLLAVADATGVADAAGGVAYIAGGEEVILHL